MAFLLSASPAWACGVPIIPEMGVILAVAAFLWVVLPIVVGAVVLIVLVRRLRWTPPLDALDALDAEDAAAPPGAPGED